MSASLSIPSNYEKSRTRHHTVKTSIWVWVSFVLLFAGLFFFVEKILAFGLLVYLGVRLVSSKLYARYADEYKDYETEYSELFRDINDILGVNKDNFNPFGADEKEINKEQIEQEKKLLKDLQRKNSDEITRKERWQLAILSERYKGTKEPLRLFLAYKADYPTDLDADYLIGKVLLDKNNKSGFPFLKRAFKKFNLISPICDLLLEYYYREDNEEKRDYWLEQKNMFLAVASEAKQERMILTPRDTLVEASLSEEVMKDIGEQLGTIKGIKSAWICEKIVEHYPEYPMYVLSVKRSHPFVDDQRLLSELNAEMDFPDTTLALTSAGKSKRCAKRVRKAGVKLVISRKNRADFNFRKTIEA